VHLTGRFWPVQTRMGCFSSKPGMEPLTPQKPHMAQPYMMPQPPAVEQQPISLQQPSMQLEAPPFMRTISPCGLPWCQYLAAALIEVDPQTGLLAGQWAECLCWAVRFEHSSDWQRMPEYACAGEGPVGGVLVALEAALGGPYSIDAWQKLQAASMLQEAMHCAAEMRQTMPIIDGPCAPSWAVAHEPMPVAGQPLPFETQGCSQPAWGRPQHFETPQPYRPYETQQPYSYAQEPYAGGGPTLLGAHQQNQGMSTGGKVALAAAGGVAAGVAGYAAASHMGGLGEAVSGAVEGVGHFAGDAFEGVGHAAGEAVEGVGGFVEDMF